MRGKITAGQAILLIGALAAIAFAGKYELAQYVGFNAPMLALGGALGIVLGVFVAWLAAGRDKSLFLVGFFLAISPLQAVAHGAVAAFSLLNQLSDPQMALSVLVAFTCDFSFYCFLLLGLQWFFMWLDARAKIATDNTKPGEPPKS